MSKNRENKEQGKDQPSKEEQKYSHSYFFPKEKPEFKHNGCPFLIEKENPKRFVCKITIDEKVKSLCPLWSYESCDKYLKEMRPRSKEELNNIVELFNSLNPDARIREIDWDKSLWKIYAENVDAEIDGDVYDYDVNAYFTREKYPYEYPRLATISSEAVTLYIKYVNAKIVLERDTEMLDNTKTVILTLSKKITEVKNLVEKNDSTYLVKQLKELESHLDHKNKDFEHFKTVVDQGEKKIQEWKDFVNKNHK